MTKDNIFIPELLAPAGDLAKLKTALLYGAAAVYLGGDELNLRAASNGLNHQELTAGVQLANRQGARVYYTLNSLPMPDDFSRLPEAIENAAAAGVHGFIVADPGVLRLIRRYAPQVEIHLSTQVNTTNSEAIAFWREWGVDRVNLARELSCREMGKIRATSPDIELEVFVHGAMCLAVSGQCLLSAWLNQRPANLGQCTQPCRFEYRATMVEEIAVDEKTRPDEVMWRVREDESYSSFWAPADLCLLPWLAWFVEHRINALKIEGRAKGASYLAHVVDAYASALRQLPLKGSRWPDPYMKELLLGSSRPLSSGFFLPDERVGLNARFAHLNRNESRVLAQVVEPLKQGAWLIDVRGRWQADFNVELMLPGMQRPLVGSYALENQRGELATLVHSGTRCVFYCQHPGIRPGIFIRQAQTPCA